MDKEQAEVISLIIIISFILIISFIILWLNEGLRVAIEFLVFMIMVLTLSVAFSILVSVLAEKLEG